MADLIMKCFVSLLFISIACVVGCFISIGLFALVDKLDKENSIVDGENKIGGDQ